MDRMARVCHKTNCSLIAKQAFINFKSACGVVHYISKLIISRHRKVGLSMNICVIVSTVDLRTVGGIVALRL